jgi:hypothetical protein
MDPDDHFSKSITVFHASLAKNARLGRLAGTPTASGNGLGWAAMEEMSLSANQAQPTNRSPRSCDRNWALHGPGAAPSAGAAPDLMFVAFSVARPASLSYGTT